MKKTSKNKVNESRQQQCILAKCISCIRSFLHTCLISYYLRMKVQERIQKYVFYIVILSVAFLYCHLERNAVQSRDLNLKKHQDAREARIYITIQRARIWKYVTKNKLHEKNVEKQSNTRLGNSNVEGAYIEIRN